MGKVIPDRKPKPVDARVVVGLHNGLTFDDTVGLAEAPAFADKVLRNGYSETRPDRLRVWPASAIAFVDIFP
ncbi:hypothetical protein [Aminobacter sp. HY435]|uniref:hypothetical protein n=1 Tax=Aminobacter sp. HY435 TaxID=2970917 RepID=UPI0022B97A7B|nr:hypothetical protein [Aminobacter sp. HY435]